MSLQRARTAPTGSSRRERGFGLLTLLTIVQLLFPLLTLFLNQRARARLRKLLALAPRREPPEFPAALSARLRRDLARDCARFRQMTGMKFSQWSL